MPGTTPVHRWCAHRYGKEGVPCASPGSPTAPRAHPSSIVLADLQKTGGKQHLEGCQNPRANNVGMSASSTTKKTCFVPCAVMSLSPPSIAQVYPMTTLTPSGSLSMLTTLEASGMSGIIPQIWACPYFSRIARAGRAPCVEARRTSSATTPCNARCWASGIGPNPFLPGPYASPVPA